MITTTTFKRNFFFGGQNTSPEETDYLSEDMILESSILDQGGVETILEATPAPAFGLPDSSWFIPSSCYTVDLDEAIFILKAGSLPLYSFAAASVGPYSGVIKASSPFVHDVEAPGNLQSFTVSVASFSGAGHVADIALYNSCGLSWAPRTQVYQDTRRLVSHLFLFRDFPTVDRFLKDNYSLQDLLVETYYHLVEFFGSDSSFELELVKDEYDPKEQQLYLLIQSGRPTEEQMSALEKFEEEWWFERSGYIVNGPVITLK